MDISSDVNGLWIRRHLTTEPKVSFGMLKNVCGKAIAQKCWSLGKQSEGLQNEFTETNWNSTHCGKWEGCWRSCTIASFQQGWISQRAACISVLSGAALASARYEEKAIAKIKDLGRVRMGRVRNQSGRVKARSKKEISNEWNEWAYFFK